MKHIIKNNILMISYILKFCPKHLFITILNSILASIVSIFNIIYIRYIINIILNNGNFTNIILLIIVFSIVQILYSCLNTWLQQVIIPRNMQIIFNKMQLEIFMKSKQVDFSCYEDPEFYDKYYIAVQQSDNRALAVLESFSTMLGNLFGITALVSLISTFDLLIMFIIFINVLLTFLLNSKIVTIQHQYFKNKSSVERLSRYAQRIFSQKEYAKEIRTFNKFYLLIENLFNNSSKNLIRLISTNGKSIASLSVIQTTISILSSSSIIAYLSHKIIISAINMGDFVALINASQKLTEQILSLINIFSQFYEHSIYIDNFKYFMEYEPLIKETDNGMQIPTELCIELKNISFSYPKTEKKVLNNINLTLPYGKKIAFVGTNGAGKSTIAKLLFRLYDPTEGEILINGLDYKEYSVRSIRESLSIVLQDYQMYAFSIAENILMRPIENKTDDEETVKNALKFVGLFEKVSSFPDGIYTNLSREFNTLGTQFSGGEYQRLVLARAYIRNSNILILDEPSSSLDPISENQILDSMFSLMKDKTVIIISHRLSNVRKADKIYLVDEGSIIESGTHEELILLNRSYAQMYKNQANRYF